MDTLKSLFLQVNWQTSPIASANLSVWDRNDVIAEYVEKNYLTPDEMRVIIEAWTSIMRQPVLDIGVGGGRTIPFIAPSASEYVAIDISEKMVCACQEKFPHINIQVGDVRKLDFDNNTFSFVFFSYNGIDYVNPDERLIALREIYRVLKPGGFFGFSSHNLNSIRQRISKFIFTWPKQTKNPLRTSWRYINACSNYIRGYRNFQRLRDQQIHHVDYAFTTDGAYHNSVLTYYVTPQTQIEQLVQAGFSRDIRIIDILHTGTNCAFLNT